MTDFCGIPLTSLRGNSVTELNLEGKGVGIPGSIVLSTLVPSATALTSLKCVSDPALPELCMDYFAFVSSAFEADSCPPPSLTASMGAS